MSGKAIKSLWRLSPLPQTQPQSGNKVEGGGEGEGDGVEGEKKPPKSCKIIKAHKLS